MSNILLQGQNKMYNKLEKFINAYFLFGFVSNPIKAD